MKLQIVLLLTILTLNISCSKKSSKKKFKSNVELFYTLESLENQECYDRLIVNYEGNKEVLIDYSEKLKLRILLIDDFNNDGNLDILLENIKGCENFKDGYSIKLQGNSYFMISSNGEDFFRTKEIGNDWDGIKMELIDKKLNFTIDSTQKRFYKSLEEIHKDDKQETYILENYSLKRQSVKLIKDTKQEIENNTFRVFAENGLIIRDKPNGKPIGKLDFGTEVNINTKTNIEHTYYDNDSRIEGYWYQIKHNSKIGYVFSGYLANTDYCSSIFTEWDGVCINTESILFRIHGQCHISFPIKILNKNEIELIWSESVDCVFTTGLSEDYKVTKAPEIGKAFAKYTFKNNKLIATYYYPEWVSKYIYSEIFIKSSEINYNNLN